MQSRAASPEDAEAIVRIYNEGIEERIATFETSPRTAREIEAWFDGTHPIVVVEEEGRGDFLRQHHGLQPPRVLLRRGRVLRIHRQRGKEPWSRHAGDEGPHPSGGGGRLLETRRACLRGERAEPEATALFRFPRGGSPRETRQARRSVARRRSRRAAVGPTRRGARHPRRYAPRPRWGRAPCCRPSPRAPCPRGQGARASLSPGGLWPTR